MGCDGLPLSTHIDHRLVDKIREETLHYIPQLPDLSLQSTMDVPSLLRET